MGEADGDYVVAVAPITTPLPWYLGLDLWMALGLPSVEFDRYIASNDWADTWANLLDAVRELAGIPHCGAPTDGGPCVLREHTPNLPHHGARDVGFSDSLVDRVLAARAGVS